MSAPHPKLFLAEIIWLAARLPLDIAADARHLIVVWLFTGQHSINRSPQVGTRDRFAVIRPTAIKLPTVNEFAVAIEKEEVGSASSPISFGDFLRFVVEIRERIAAILGLVHHLFGRVG